ncbi:MAG: CDP-alcohol phosphatidyltransferase family protein [Candidatus Aenigmarchaeota archaeon]|nr:CDP-alcohol phosphatidyltransferase family protein [Candidatus Aenigmarchaeota archaeon]MDI6722472.1 CDP-alcohol phosphatidyltransferase family protein [Candidatus Aenigmarchaeota archaeon]
MLYKNRKKFENLSAFVGKKFSFLKPNQWTLLSLIMAAVTFYFIASSSFLLGSIFFVVMSFLDFVDGSVARATKTTKKGAFYDTITDRYVEFFIIASLFFASLPDVIISIKLWLMVFLFGSLMTTYTRASAYRDLGREIKGGLLERSERLIILFIGIASAIFSVSYLSYIIVILAVLSNITALQRIKMSLEGI